MTATSDPTIVDARFAGGHLAVSSAPLAHDESFVAVALDGPGFALKLFPHEARALADALLQAVTAAEVTA